MRRSDTGAQAQGHSSGGDNRLHSVGNYLKFLLPSLGGALFFLPAVVATGIDSELTRFVIIATSIVQLIYMSEVGVFILAPRAELIA
jgi:hypothetical protein